MLGIIGLALVCPRGVVCGQAAALLVRVWRGGVLFRKVMSGDEVRQRERWPRFQESTTGETGRLDPLDPRGEFEEQEEVL